MTGARKLLRAGEASGTGTDHGHSLARFQSGRIWPDPAFFPRLVDDRVLDRLDADRVIVDPKSARFLTGRRTNPPRKFGEIVGRVERLDRRFPVLLVNEVVEIGNDVVDGAAAHAKRNAAIHAARTLDFGLIVAQAMHELVVMLFARR